MSTSFNGDVSFIEVYGNVYGIKNMLEKYNKKSRTKHHIVVVKRKDAQPERFILPGHPHLILQRLEISPISVLSMISWGLYWIIPGSFKRRAQKLILL